MTVLSIFIIYLSFVSYTNAIRCYTCSYASGTGNMDCVEDPHNQLITNCDRKYCTIVRQELINPDGFIQSFVRGCSDRYDEEDAEDPTYRTYLRACRNDLCNDGTGKSSIGGGLLDDDFENLLVPGISNGARKILTNFRSWKTILVITQLILYIIIK